MPLSEQEQKLLEQMEQALYADDPKFASNLRSPGTGATRKRAALGVLAVLAGMGLDRANEGGPACRPHTAQWHNNC
jgi:hypothetical protein